MRLLAALVSCVICAGCITVPAVTAYAPPTVEITTPVLGAVTEVRVGDYLIEAGLLSEADAIGIPAPVQMTGFTLPAGEYVKIGTMNGKEMFRASQGGGPAINANALYPGGMVITVSGEVVCLGDSTFVCGKSPLLTRFKKRASNAPNFSQTLIYNGKIGSKIAVAYREFSNDVARPAFSNSAEYDLKESKVIGYRGARIEVLDANNETIKYRVLSYFTTQSH